MECSCLKASSLHREPGLSWSGHPVTPSKDGQCCLASPFCSAHFPPALLSIAFPSAQLSTSPGPSPTPRPAQTISLSRKEAGVQVTCFSGCFSTEHCLSSSQPGNRALTPSPISRMDWTSPHSVASPSKDLDQSQPGECRAASLF